MVRRLIVILALCAASASAVSLRDLVARISAVGVSESPYAYLSTNLVAWWKLDEGSGSTVIDSSVYTNAGSTVNSPYWTNAVPSLSFANPYSLCLNGNTQGCVIADSTSLKPTSAITVAAWINPNNVTANKIIVDHQSGAPYYGYIMLMLTNKFLVNAAYNVNGKDVVSVSSIATNTWTHVLFTYDSADIRIYINGVLDKTTVATGAVSYTVTQSLTLGKRAVSGISSPFNGLLDDVRIYNRALTSNEVSYISSGGL